MPVYSYVCDGCKHRDLEFRSMRNATTIGACIECPVCREPYYRRTIDSVHTDLKEFHKPILMLSVACNTLAEIREIQRKCPGVEISDNPQDEHYGVPRVKNRSEKKQVLKVTGFMERN